MTLTVLKIVFTIKYLLLKDIILMSNNKKNLYPSKFNLIPIRKLSFFSKLFIEELIILLFIHFLTVFNTKEKKIEDVSVSKSDVLKYY